MEKIQALLPDESAFYVACVNRARAFPRAQPLVTSNFRDPVLRLCDFHRGLRKQIREVQNQQNEEDDVSNV